MDVTKTVGQQVRFLPGMEFGLSNNFYLRGGYQVTDQEGSGLAAGFGLRMLGHHKVNYVYAPFGDLGDTHRAELVFHLGTVPVNTSFNSSEKFSPSQNGRAKEAINQVQKISSADGIESLVNGALLPPVDLKIEKMPNSKMKLIWNSISGENTGYLIYAKREGGSRWIKLTSSPIKNTFQLFTPKRDNVKLVFVVTAIRGGEESDFSEPAYFSTP